MREDVTERRLNEVGHEGGFSSFGTSARARPGKTITKTELRVYDAVPVEGLHIGRWSKALLYAPAIKHLAYSKPDRAALIKLLKRGLLRIEHESDTGEEYLVRVTSNPRRNSRETAREKKWRTWWSAEARKHSFVPGPGGQQCDICGARERAPIHTLRNSRRARVTAKGRRARPRKRNPLPRGAELRDTFTLSSLKAVRRGGRVEKVWYQDARDSKHYYHDFESEHGAIMYLCESAALGKCVLIVSGDLSTPLWENA